ncbi:hypothetical protein J4413_02030 [Candidatus Woesearchaeota archaeon]|nr:hypothetical protein [Candidatus Woesearchaeota archaeon]
MDERILKYYSRKDVQKRILEIASNREMAVSFNGQGYGKRPDILQFENDVPELVKSGATSFHFSEEKWSNPLLLEAGMMKKKLDELRVGWDLIIDVDSKNFEFSRQAAFLIIEALKFHDIKNISVKFSGNRGFHIGIPFKAFPKKVNDVDIKLLFPDGPRVVAAYLKYIIKDHLTAKLLENNSLDKISKDLGIEKEKMTENGIFNPFSLVDIDTVLISNRHMFRAPYSLNEKSGLVSAPIKSEDILNFSRETAEIENVKTDLGYMNDNDFKEEEARNLITQAFDWNQKLPSQSSEKVSETKKEFETVKDMIPEGFFPPCMLLGLKGLEDGRKRFLFILLNFLKNTGYDYSQIEKVVSEWNKKNTEPLRDNYINAQISWHKRQKGSLLPPNCDNQQYYPGINICNPDGFCKFIKNPVHYSLRKKRMENQNKKKGKSTKKTN